MAMRVAFKKIASSASSKVCTEAVPINSTGIFAALEKSKNAKYCTLTWLLILIPVRIY